MIPFSCTGMNLPCESGPAPSRSTSARQTSRWIVRIGTGPVPRSRLLLSETCPRISVPPTTAPTPATAKVSSMWNCGSSLRVCVSSSCPRPPHAINQHACSTDIKTRRDNPDGIIALGWTV
eukprot:585909-Rhodomonas_salina.2